MSETIVETTLYEKIGGKAAVDAAVELFYKKVLADDRISDFFTGVDVPQLIKHQKLFLTYAFGGAPNYSGQSMSTAHKKLVDDLGLNDTHFDAVMENLGGTLVELGVPDDLIGEAAAIAESTREAILGRA